MTFRLPRPSVAEGGSCLKSSARLLGWLPILIPFTAGAAAATNSAPLSLWDTLVRGSVGAGYRANVLQTSVAPEDSAFFQSSAEVSVDRFADDGRLWSLFLLGEDTRYFDSPSVPNEQFLSGTARVILPLGESDRIGGLLQYLYQHQVLDVSETEAELRRVLVKGHSLAFRPDWRHAWNPEWSVTLEGLMNRQWYVGELDDYWEGGGRLSLTRSYGYRSELAVSYQVKRLIYDTRRQTDGAGLPVTGTSLCYWQHEAAAQWRHNWDAARHWQTRLKAGYLRSQDNGSGYFDYHRVLFATQARWQDRGWEVQANARFGWYFYDRQSMGNQLLERSYCTLDTRVERRLGKYALLYATAEKDWNAGNDPLDRFADWMFSSGVGVEF